MNQEQERNQRQGGSAPSTTFKLPAQIQKRKESEEKPVYESLAYTWFKSCGSSMPKTSCNAKNPPCFLASVDNASCSSEQLLIGGLCLTHNSEFFNRKYVITPAVKAVAMKRAKYEEFGFLFSTMTEPMSISDVKAKLALSPSKSEINKHMIAQYISTLSQTQKSCPLHTDVVPMQIFSINLANTYKQLLLEHDQALQQISVYFEVSNDQLEALKATQWFKDAQDSIFVDDRGDVFVLSVPFKKLLIIDQVLMLGFSTQVRSGETGGVLPNVSMTNGRYVYGVGFGINNAYELASRVVSQQSLFCEYESSVKDLLLNTQNVFPSTVNLDYLYMTALSSTKSIPILVTGRSFTYKIETNVHDSDLFYQQFA